MAMSEAQTRAKRKYDAKTYLKLTFYLRHEDDAEIIESIRRAKQNGISLREWLHDLYSKK